MKNLISAISFIVGMTLLFMMPDEQSDTYLFDIILTKAPAIFCLWLSCAVNPIDEDESEQTDDLQ